MASAIRKSPRRFQFTPLREGRPKFRALYVRAFISIHAPPRGATADGGSGWVSLHHFNSRPSARGDLLDFFGRFFLRAFQFTPLREGRLMRLCDTWTESEFQFTPLREGRRTAASTRKRLRNFNSRPSARGDGAGRIAGPMSKDFISRPSARGDARFPRFPFGLRHFNSRPSARGDSWQPTRRAWMDIFQFTPLREGRRRWRDGNVSARRISIHAPPRGATGCSFQNNLWAIISIHAPPRGATIPANWLSGWIKFQFTPLREGRRNGRWRSAIRS